MDDSALRDFIAESNRIDAPLTDGKRGQRANGGCSETELEAFRELLAAEELTRDALTRFVQKCEPGARLRDKHGIQCRIGPDKMPDGGESVVKRLDSLLSVMGNGNDPFLTHQLYEDLHPFDRCNGHSGRAVWLWQMVRKEGKRPSSFLVSWYFETLSRARR